VNDEPIEKLKAELFRLRARPEDVPGDGIVVVDHGHGNASLQSRRGPDFDWFGNAADILDRLSGLPDGSGPEAIRSEFG